MGCFNGMGFLSRLPICCGDETVALICEINDGGIDKSDYHTGLYYTNSQLNPICLPVYGIYNDYGYLYDIEENGTTRLLEKFFEKPIEEIIKTFAYFGSVEPTAKDMIDRQEDLHDAHSIILDKLIEIDDRRKNPKKYVLLLEHKEFFNQCCSVNKYDNIEKDIEHDKEILRNAIKIFGEKSIKDEDPNVLNDYFEGSFINLNIINYCLKVLKEPETINDVLKEQKEEYLKSIYMNKYKPLTEYFYNWKNIFPFYRYIDHNFVDLETSEIIKMSSLDLYMLSIQDCLLYPYQPGQNNHLSQKKKHYKRCIDFINVLMKKDK